MIILIYLACAVAAAMVLTVAACIRMAGLCSQDEWAEEVKYAELDAVFAKAAPHFREGI